MIWLVSLLYVCIGLAFYCHKRFFEYLPWRERLCLAAGWPLVVAAAVVVSVVMVVVVVADRISERH